MTALSAVFPGRVNADKLGALGEVRSFLDRASRRPSTWDA